MSSSTPNDKKPLTSSTRYKLRHHIRPEKPFSIKPQATFTPLVFSTTGGMALEASQFLKHLAENISIKNGQRYSDVMSFVRRRLRFDLLRTCIISIRGYRGTRTLPPTAISDLDLNLINTPKS